MLGDWLREGWSSAGLDAAHAWAEKLACDSWYQSKRFAILGSR